MLNFCLGLPHLTIKLQQISAPLQHRATKPQLGKVHRVWLHYNKASVVHLLQRFVVVDDGWEVQVGGG